MGFGDIFKKSFLEGYASSEIGTREIVMALLIAGLIGLYIFVVYRLLTRRTFYSKNFNISLVAMACITCAIILTIQSSIVVSLGMVGALSIVRFRTAIKEPMDLVFLFWSISVGIICGAGLAEIAVILSLGLTAVLFVLDLVPVAKAPMILVISADSTDEVNDQIREITKKFSTVYNEKSRCITDGHLDLVLEVRVKEGAKMTEELSGVPGIGSVSLLSHDGEVTY